jgi:7-carboxy-7-deazaguanine synthase
MEKSFRLQNLPELRTHDELKFVMAGRDDYEWACAFIRRHGLAGRGIPLLFSPVYGALPASELAGWIGEDNLPTRLNLQLHKYIWGPGEGGK